MKYKILWIILLLIIGGYFFAKANPDNAFVVRVQNMLGRKTAQIMTGPTDTGEVLPVEQSTGIDLTNCISYFDGCNNCSVKDGKPDACTLMYCETPAEPKCLEYSSDNNGSMGIANPASVNCEEKGGMLEIVTQADGGQIGMCHLPDGIICEERAYFRGECPE